jgi:hypothetical protein
MFYLPTGGRVRAGLALVAALAVHTVHAQGRPRITVHAFEEDDGPTAPADAEALANAVGDAVSADARVSFTSLRDLLQPPDGGRALRAADLQVVDAEKAFAAMELDQAKKLLEQAIDVYRAQITELAARGGGQASALLPLRDAWLKLAKTRYFDGDPDGAGDALRYAFVLDPRLGYSKALFPPTMKKAVVEAKLLFETLGPGKLAIDSDPPGATVFVNGARLSAPTPTEAPELPPGPSYVTFERHGYQSITVVVENKGEGETTQVLQSLSRWPKNPLGALDRDRRQIYESVTPPHAGAAARLLGVDLIVLARAASADGADGRRLALVLYDARFDRVLGRVIVSAREAQLFERARALVPELLSKRRPELSVAAASAPPPPSGWDRFYARTKTDLGRFYHWKYFWYVVGGVAGAVVLGSAVGGGVAWQRQQAADAVVLFGGH